MNYQANNNRYHKMIYKQAGQSGLKLPAISLGLWHNFGGVDVFENGRKILHHAFDAGITHFDLANNYGPPAGSAEENFGKILRSDFKAYRDEMVISTKAGYYMWPGPYGDWGSRKYLLSSLDQSLNRLGLEYVDIFYSHRPDPNTPLEETMTALDHAVKQGKALYVGISNYTADQTLRAAEILQDLGTPCLIHQPRYNMFDRWVEDGLLDVLEEKGIGCIPFSPLAQGILTNKYLNGIPEGSRAEKEHGFLKKELITDEKIEKVRKLNEIAKKRGQSIAQLALAWIFRDKRITSVLIGVSHAEQLQDNLNLLDNINLSGIEQDEIEKILK
ncbi:MAG: L-glyceraldehyde 3-phosphate reductase [Bacteroidota bacterium]